MDNDHRVHSVQLVPAHLGHALLVARGVRDAAKSHFGSHDETRRAACKYVQSSNYARALMINGRCVGVGGETSPLLEPVGFVWAAGTVEGLRHRFLVARLVKREIEQLLQRRDGLTCTMLASDRAGIRFAEFLGFVFGPEREHQGITVRDGTIMRVVSKAA